MQKNNENVNKNFYKKYQFWLTKWGLFVRYIRRNYRRIHQEVKNHTPFSEKERFTGLLCGTSGEITSYEFSKLLMNHNVENKIVILDLGSEQIKQSEKLLKEKFPEADFEFHVCDARKTKFKSGSIDFIETDFMFEYLDSDGLVRLFEEWQRILSHQGIVTFRSVAHSGLFTRFLYSIFNIWIRVFLGSKSHSHSKVFLDEVISSNGFSWEVTGYEGWPLGYRYRLRKK